MTYEQLTERLKLATENRDYLKEKLHDTFDRLEAIVKEIEIENGRIADLRDQQRFADTAR